jgi:hypothetical protein
MIGHIVPRSAVTGRGSDVGSPCSRNCGGAAAMLLVRAAKTRPLGGRLSVPAAARVLRTPVKNRVDNELIRTPAANHRRRRTDALAVVLPTDADRDAHSRVATAPRPSRDQRGRNRGTVDIGPDARPITVIHEGGDGLAQRPRSPRRRPGAPRQACCGSGLVRGGGPSRRRDHKTSKNGPEGPGRHDRGDSTWKINVGRCSAAGGPFFPRRARGTPTLTAPSRHRRPGDSGRCDESSGSGLTAHDPRLTAHGSWHPKPKALSLEP